MSEFITKVVIAADNQTAPAVNAATKGIQNYAKAATAAQSQVRGASRQSRAALQQLGYQVQDISVQLQAGQSPFVVLAQQGSQVASIFGPGGAVIGALIAVGGAIAGNLLPSLFKGSVELKELEERAKSLGKTLKILAPEAGALYEEGQRKELAKVEAELAKLRATKEADATATAKSTTFGKAFEDALKKQSGQVENQEKAIAELILRREQLRREITPEFEGGGNTYKPRSYTPDNAFTKMLQAQEDAEAALSKIKSPLDELIEKQALYTSWLNLGGVSQDNFNKLMTAAGEAYASTIPKAKEETKELKEKYETTNAFMVAYEKYLAQQERGAELTKSVISPLETLQANTQEYLSLLNAGALTQETFNRLIEENGKKYESAIGYTEAAKSALAKYAEEATNLDEQLKGLAMGGINSIEEGFIDLISGSKSVAESFRSMARSIVNDLIKIQIQRSITGPLAGMMEDAGGIGGIFNKIFGGARASGGPVQSGKAYLVGENGPELMMPSNSGYVVNNEDLTSGGSSEGITIVQNINVTTGVQQTVRAEIMGMMPQIANASKQAVLDAKRRGGSFSGAF